MKFFGPIAALMLAVGAPAALAQRSAFTYQGELKDNGQPASGSYDLIVTVYDDPFEGNPVSKGECINDRPVTNGIVTVDVPSFDPVAGVNYYVELHVRRHRPGVDCDDSAGFTKLTPRQRIAPTPQADAARTARALAASDGTPRHAVETDAVGNLYAYQGVSVLGKLGVGHYTPSNPLDIRAGSSSYFMVDNSGDLRANGGTDGNFWTVNEGASTGGTHFAGNGATRFSILNSGNVGIGTQTPGKKLTVAGDMEIGTSAGDYRHLRIGGGNSSGFLYGSFPLYADGIHMGYNYYADSTNHRVIHPDGGTSRVTMGYGFVSLATGGVGATPVDRLRITDFGRVGIDTADPQALLHVNGTIRCTSLVQTSSAAFKDDVQPLQAGLDELMKLEPVSYVWNDLAPEEARGRHDLGFIAEEVANILPDAVARDEAGKPVGIDYTRITVLAVKAIKDQKSKHDAELRDMQERLEKLEAALQK